MPNRFLNTTETDLVSLVKTVMKRHQPLSPGIWKSFLDFVRSRTVGLKPNDAHSLSVLVTEDLLVEIIEKFGSADISSAFINVMSLADEEVTLHYARPERSPFLAGILADLLESLKESSEGYSKDWDISFFARFVSDYLRENNEELSNEHLNQALEILISPKHYRLLSVNWLLLRFIAAGYIEVARGANGVQQGFVSSGDIHHLRRSSSDVLFDLPESESLKCMLEDEVEAMMSLYSLVLLSPYIDEEYQTAQNAFRDTHPRISWVLNKCDALLSMVGSASMVFYMGSMIGSIIAQLVGEMGSSAADDKLLLDLFKSKIKRDNTPQYIVDWVLRKQASSVPAAIHSSSVDTLGTIIGNASAPTLSNYSAMPASVSLLAVMYVSVPIIMFGGFASKWVTYKIESRTGTKFVPPSLLSPIVVTQGFKLVMNTLLSGTAHIEESATNALLNWTVKRLYLPMSLTGQPAKTTGFLNSALAASPTNRHKQITLDAKACAIATVASLPFEFAAHALSNYGQLTGTRASGVLSAFAMLFSMVLKSARIFALFGPALHARRYNPGNYAYSSYFEQMLWIDGVKAITAPVVLLGFDLATTPLSSTLVLTFDSLVSYIPDIMLGVRYGMLNKAASKLTALNSWLYRNDLSSQEIVKLATMATLEDVPGAAKASLMYMLERRLNKNVPQDLGMDLIVDPDGPGGVEQFSDVEMDMEEGRQLLRGGGAGRHFISDMELSEAFSVPTPMYEGADALRDSRDMSASVNTLQEAGAFLPSNNLASTARDQQRVVRPKTRIQSPSEVRPADFIGEAAPQPIARGNARPLFFPKDVHASEISNHGAWQRVQAKKKDERSDMDERAIAAGREGCGVSLPYGSGFAAQEHAASEIEDFQQPGAGIIGAGCVYSERDADVHGAMQHLSESTSNIFMSLAADRTVGAAGSQAPAGGMHVSSDRFFEDIGRSSGADGGAIGGDDYVSVNDEECSNIDLQSNTDEHCSYVDEEDDICSFVIDNEVAPSSGIEGGSSKNAARQHGGPHSRRAQEQRPASPSPFLLSPVPLYPYERVGVTLQDDTSDSVVGSNLSNVNIHDSSSHGEDQQQPLPLYMQRQQQWMKDRRDDRPNLSGRVPFQPGR